MRMHERTPRYLHAPRCPSSMRDEGSGAGTPRARSMARDMAVSWRMAMRTRSARVSGLGIVHHLGTSYGAAARADGRAMAGRSDRKQRRFPRTPHEMRKPPIGTAFGVGLLTSVRLSASRRTLLIPHRAPRMVRILRVSRQIRGAARTSRSPRTSLRPLAARFGASCGSPRRSPPTCRP